MPGPKLVSVLVQILGILYFVQAQTYEGKLIKSIPFLISPGRLDIPGLSSLAINSGVDSRS